MTDIQLQATWEEILKNLENSLSTRVCNNWLKPLKPIKLTTEMLELGAPNVLPKLGRKILFTIFNRFLL